MVIISEGYTVSLRFTDAIKLLKLTAQTRLNSWKNKILLTYHTT